MTTLPSSAVSILTALHWESQCEGFLDIYKEKLVMRQLRHFLKCSETREKEGTLPFAQVVDRFIFQCIVCIEAFIKPVASTC